jgi:small subunit ribosomal protein S6
MYNYELVALVNPEVDEEALSKIADKVAQSINSRGGAVEETKDWGRRKLAYPVKRFMEAHYVLTRFSLMPQSVKEIKKDITAAGDILRCLVVKVGD